MHFVEQKCFQFVILKISIDAKYHNHKFSLSNSRSSALVKNNAIIQWNKLEKSTTENDNVFNHALAAWSFHVQHTNNWLRHGKINCVFVSLISMRCLHLQYSLSMRIFFLLHFAQLLLCRTAKINRAFSLIVFQLIRWARAPHSHKLTSVRITFVLFLFFWNKNAIVHSIRLWNFVAKTNK